MKGRSNRQVAKVARKLEKASKAHAQQAKTLKKVAKMKMGGRAVLGTLSPLYGAATGQGLFGEVGEFGLGGQLGKAFRRRKGKEEEAMQNPRNVQVDEKGRPIANPAPRAAQLAPAKRLQGGGVTKTGRKKPNPKMAGVAGLPDYKAPKKPISASEAFRRAGDIAKRERGFAQPKVEATATSQRDRRALDGLAQRGMTKGTMK